MAKAVVEMTREEKGAVAIKIVAKKLGYRLRESSWIKESHDFSKDLRAHDHEISAIKMALETKFGIMIEPKDEESITSIKKFIDYYDASRK